MLPAWVAHIAVGLLPVVVFLGFLVYLDSYKLLKVRTVVLTVAAGAGMAVLGYFANGALMPFTPGDFTTYSRYFAPVVEEALKALVVVVMIRQGRMGFLVDAAILGFAVGAGFSILENIYYLLFLVSPSAGMATWIIRGFGTAIMHGGATAIFAVAGLNFLDRPDGHKVVMLLPAFVLATVVHSAYNHMLLPAALQTLVVIVAMPALLAFAFRLSEKSMGSWLGAGFDADAELLQLLNSGQLGDAPLGKYLTTLKQKFHGPVVADILCYVRIYTELALRAKGLLMMRETGFEAPVDQATRDKFAELDYLERSIGRTGQMAIRPMLHLSLKDLRQLNLLK